MRQLIRNSITTPDGHEMVSRTRHDYKTYVDANGLCYMVDGGLSYLRRNEHNKEPYVESSLYTDDPHELLRKEITWGAIVDGKHKYIPIAQMSRAHIDNIIKDGYKGVYVELMEAELVWRRDNEFTDLEDELEKEREESYG